MVNNPPCDDSCSQKAGQCYQQHWFLLHTLETLVKEGGVSLIAWRQHRDDSYGNTNNNAATTGGGRLSRAGEFRCV